MRQEVLASRCRRSHVRGGTDPRTLGRAAGALHVPDRYPRFIPEVERRHRLSCPEGRAIWSGRVLGRGRTCGHPRWLSLPRRRRAHGAGGGPGRGGRRSWTMNLAGVVRPIGSPQSLYPCRPRTRGGGPVRAQGRQSRAGVVPARGGGPASRGSTTGMPTSSPRARVIRKNSDSVSSPVRVRTHAGSSDVTLRQDLTN